MDGPVAESAQAGKAERTGGCWVVEVVADEG